MIKTTIHRCEMLYYHLAVRMPDLIEGSLKGNGVKAYWFRDVVNFGDLITPLLLKYYGFTPIHTMPHRAELVSVGSILEHLSDSFAGTILGSGFIHEESRMSFPKATVLSVRGKLTRERIGVGRGNIALGDPGLLAAIVLKTRADKKYLLGIIPHHVDVASPNVRNIQIKHSPRVMVIDPMQQPIEVFKLIDQCEYILSSSLHGLIVADSLGIPNGWLSVGGLTGGRFKFDDYYSALNVSTGQPVTLTGEETLNELIDMTSSKPADRVMELQDALHTQWSHLRQVV